MHLKHYCRVCDNHDSNHFSRFCDKNPASTTLPPKPTKKLKPANEESKIHFETNEQFTTIELGLSPPTEMIDMLLAHSWDEDKQDPSGWWMSEKLDGVRCYWNGTTFLSRNSKPYSVPPFFVENLPKTVSLDGELWIARKKFQHTVSVVRKQQHTKNYDAEAWREVKFVLFDAPSITQPFEYRLQYLKYLETSINQPHIVALEHIRCRNKGHLLEDFKRIVEAGGEGMMIRQPESLYDHQRSKTLQKVKIFKDAEAIVLNYEDGKGKHKGLMGALKVKNWGNGKEFKLGSGFTDGDRIDPPQIGQKVTYKYQELTDGGLPRFPIFVRVCPEL